MSKGSRRRPRYICIEEYDLRWKLAMGKITFDEFQKKYKELHDRGKIRRDKNEH